MEAGEAARVARKTRAERSYCRGRFAYVGARSGTPRKYSDNLKGNNNDSGKIRGAWGRGGGGGGVGGKGNAGEPGGLPWDQVR